MSFDGTRWVAQDLETLTAFTLFADLEQAYARAQKAGDEEGSAPGALVGITSEIVAADLFPLPLLTSDNAAYAPPLDGWLTLRVGLQQGVPFAMSLPVLAHEFGHRLFFRNVFKRDAAFQVWRSRTDDKAGKQQQRSNRINQGFDEGLADFFSLSVTGDNDGIPRAFRQAEGVFVAEADRRDLEGEFASAATYDNLNDLTLDSRFLESCGADNGDPLFEQGTFNFYCLGTVLARSLWDGSDRDIGVLREEVLPAVIKAYAAVGERLARDPLFDAEFLLQPIIENVDAPRAAALCAAFAQKFPSTLAAAKVPGCP
jgi:hypothetical protein